MSDQPPSVSKAFQVFMTDAPRHAHAWGEMVRGLAGASALDGKTAALAYGKPYTARLAGTIRTTGGAALGADHVWQFTVEPLFRYTRLPLIRR